MNKYYFDKNTKRLYKPLDSAESVLQRLNDNKIIERSKCDLVDMSKSNELERLRYILINYSLTSESIDQITKLLGTLNHAVAFFNLKTGELYYAFGIIPDCTTDRDLNFIVLYSQDKGNLKACDLVDFLRNFAIKIFNS